MPAILPLVPLITGVLGAGAAAYSGYQSNQANQRTQNAMDATQQRQMGAYDQANQQIPGMQGVANTTAQAGQGFLADRQAFADLNGQYAPLMAQMQRLYGQDPTSEASGYLRAQLGTNGEAARLRQNATDVLGATSTDAYNRQAQLAGDDALGQLSSSLAARGIASSGASSRLGASTLARLYADAQARGQQDRLSAYGISNNALQAAGGMQSSIASQLGQMGLAGQQQQAGLLGQMGNLLGAQQQGIQAQSGALGNYLAALQQQYGQQQGIANQYMQQGNAMGGVYGQQQQQINPNPYGGLGAALGGIGTAAGNLFQQRYAGGPGTGLTGIPTPGIGVSYPRGGTYGGVNPFLARYTG
ncbi:hypothetical protein [Deinococcus sp. Leaf326]|uniref:hypothetical protein n=1 Tax=Deinococcus sp. Leaf326 TaxID=1736338 RepID=UPI0006F6ED91|nr:hypothetical protein [Deinococcus sp. Leaf326]KQR22861.1 hypothetical protein ASF71_06760 [Deinococcus sp. Leaf326]